MSGRSITEKESRVRNVPGEEGSMKKDGWHERLGMKTVITGEWNQDYRFK